MEIEKIMHTNVVCVRPDDTLRKVRDIFAKNKFHHLIVGDHRRLVGIISDRDYLKALSPAVGTSEETLQDCKCLERKASEIMTKKVVAVKKEITIKTAAQLMLVKNVSCLPVATDEGKVIGIITLRGLLQHYVEIDDDDRKRLFKY